MSKKSLACWIDGPEVRLRSIEQRADEIAEVFTDAIIVTNQGVVPFWRIRWDKVNLSRFTMALLDRGVSVQWMLWPYAMDRSVELLIENVKSYCAFMKANHGKLPDALNLDLEGKHDHSGWGPGGVDLAKRLVEGLMAEAPLSATTINPIRGMRRQDLEVLKYAKWLQGNMLYMPQAYSQFNPQKAWSAHELYRPGVIQRHCAEQCRELLSEGVVSKVWMGMMVGMQSHPKPPSGVAALKVAFDTARDQGFDDFCIWSWKHIRPSSEAFLKSLKDQPVSAALAPEPKSESALVLAIQRALAARRSPATGSFYRPGPLDGVFGPRTSAALLAFEKDHGFKQDGVLDGEVIKALL